MEQSVIDKLMELKRLYEAGILTKEELEMEKRKVLKNVEDVQREKVVVQQKVQENASSASVPEWETSLKDMQKNVSELPIPTEENNKAPWMGICVAVLSLAIIIYVLVSNKINTTDDYDCCDDISIDSASVDEYWEDADAYEESIDTDDDGIAEVLDMGEDTSEHRAASIVHYRVNREVSVYQGPGSNYEVALFEAQGGRDYPASYDSGNIVESTGKTANGYIFVSDCGCQGGHGFNQDGWIPANAVSRMSICSNCGGAGYFNVVCPQCDGGAYYSCSCHGRGMMVCDICGGVGAL